LTKIQAYIHRSDPYLARKELVGDGIVGYIEDILEVDFIVDKLTIHIYKCYKA